MDRNSISGLNYNPELDISEGIEKVRFSK